MTSSEIFSIPIIIITISIVALLIYLLLPTIHNNIIYWRIKKSAAELKADGLRSIDEIAADMIVHKKALAKLEGEMERVVLWKKDDNKKQPNHISNIPDVDNIIFNSSEIGCRYQGLELPKFLKRDDGVWFEFESPAWFNDEGFAVVKDPKRNYITVSDNTNTNTSFFYVQLTNKPLLNSEDEIKAKLT